MWSWGTPPPDKVALPDATHASKGYSRRRPGTSDRIGDAFEISHSLRQGRGERHHDALSDDGSRCTGLVPADETMLADFEEEFAETLANVWQASHSKAPLERSRRSTGARKGGSACFSWASGMRHWTAGEL